MSQSLSDNNFTTLTPSESEFLAEEIMVTIVPNVNHPSFHFISGRFGPLESGLPCDIPLWLAITLRKRGKCVIKMPSWMEPEYLEQLVSHERSQLMLGALPFYFMETAHLLLTHANEDIASPDRIIGLLQDLEHIRMDRLRIGINAIADTVKQDQSVVSTSLNNISSMEILSMKNFFLGSLDAFLWLRPCDEDSSFRRSEQDLSEAAPVRGIRKFSRK